MHEHLDAFGIINMNGRVYDPLTAQFFSPDPFVQAPDNWVNYNRYTYCFNNPLIYSDPSGYENEASSAWRILEFGGSWSDFSNALIYGSSGSSGGNYGGGGGGWYNNNYGAPMEYYYTNGKFYNEHGDQVSREEYIAGNTIAYATGPNAVLLLMHYGYEYKQPNYYTKVYNSNGQYLGNKINDFGGIKGLTVFEFRKYSAKTDPECDDDWAGVKISLSYTGTDAKYAKFAQYYTTNMDNGNQINEGWDGNNGTDFYYTSQQLEGQIKGNTIFFDDHPNGRFADALTYCKFTLFLLDSNNNIIFKLWYSYSNSGKQDGAVTTTINGLTVGYP